MEVEKSIFYTSEPLYALLLDSIDIVATDSVPIAGISTDHELLINYEKWQTFTLKQRLWVLRHELEHIIRQHVLRGSKLLSRIDRVEENLSEYTVLMNIVQDTIINEDLGTEDCPIDNAYTIDYLDSLGIPTEGIDTDYSEQLFMRLLTYKDRLISNSQDTVVYGVSKQELQYIGYANDRLQRIIEEGKDLVDAYFRKPETGSSIDWRGILRLVLKSHIAYNRDYLHPSRRELNNGLKLRGITRNNDIQKVLVVCDVSASIENHHLGNILSLVNELGVKCDVICHDYEVYETNPENIEFKGGRGTDFGPVFEYIAGKDYATILWQTDSDGNWPDSYPEESERIIFLLVDGDRDLEKLSGNAILNRPKNKITIIGRTR